MAGAREALSILEKYPITRETLEVRSIRQLLVSFCYIYVVLCTLIPSFKKSLGLLPIAVDHMTPYSYSLRPLRALPFL